MIQDDESSGATTAMPAQTDPLNASSARPDVVVLDSTYQSDDEASKEKPLSNERDLWLSTVDGRYCSHPIPVRVGSLHNMQTFHVHKDVLVKADWFRKALCGNFREADEQVIDLPEEDPAIFHFLVAFLYEERFNPIQPAASALEPPLDKGKGLDIDPEPADGSDSSSTSHTSTTSRNSDTSEMQWQNRRRTRIPAYDTEAGQEKQPGIHRPGCACPLCLSRQEVTRCWQCGARRIRPNSHYPPPRGGVPAPPGARIIQARGVNIVNVPRLMNEAPRIKGEDLRTWLMAYELAIDVYICANRYLMDNFRKCVMRSCIDMLETAGTDAAHPEVLRLCRKLFAGVPETDPLLKMVLARVGFLQSTLWKRAPEETSEFLVENPELAAAILRETVMRHEATFSVPDLPSMEGA